MTTGGAISHRRGRTANGSLGNGDVVAAGGPDRLDRALAAAVPGLSRGAARRLIADGAVFVNGRRCRIAGRIVRGGDRLRVERTPPATPPAAVSIVYEDNEVIAIDKPAGMPSAPTRRAAAGTALEVLRRQVRAPDGRPRPLWLVHRLDAGTSGVLLFARTRAAAAALSAAFRQGAVPKTYVAMVDGVVGDECGVIDRPIRVERGRAAVAAGGKPARTAWRVRRREVARTLLDVQPHTGRTHQVRVHLSALGFPIVGDRAYGGPAAPRLMLHAAAVRVPTGRSGEARYIRAPLPREFGA